MSFYRSALWTTMMALAFAGVVFCNSAHADGPVAEAPAGETITILSEAKMVVPSEFEPTEPMSGIIQHEYKVKAGEEIARLTMMPAGGDVAANITRWKGQFAGGDADKIKSEEIKAGDCTVHLVDVNGSYTETMGGGPFSGGKTVKRENYAMVGAIIVNKADQKYFLKLIGPATVVDANRIKFVEMVQSIGK
jgi:hypothetical protein